MKSGIKYNFMSATGFSGSMDNFRKSWLWENTEFTKTGNELYVKVGNIKDLKTGIESEKPSDNERAVAGALDEINKSLSGTEGLPDFLEKVLYADNAAESKAIIKQLSGEGYGSVGTTALRTMKAFQKNTASVLGEIRAAAARSSSVPQSFYSGYGYGRSGGDVYRTNSGYQPYYQGSSSSQPYYYGSPESYRRGYQQNTGYSAEQTRSYSSPQSYGGYGNYQGYGRTGVRTSDGGIWLKPFYAKYTQDDKDTISGYDSTTYGISAGFDVAGEDFSFGLMGLYATGKMEQNDKLLKADTDTFGIGFYGSTLPKEGEPFVDFHAAWVQSGYSAKRQVPALYDTFKSDFDVVSYSGGVGAGYQLRAGNVLTIIPHAGIEYALVQPDDFTEKGTSEATLSVKNDKYQSIQSNEIVY